jgi:hypothetical protein
MHLFLTPKGTGRKREKKKKKLNEKHTRRENLYKTNYIRVNFV